ncbi:hypothetical protein JL722_5377 [Aureococcus anophagefferens]|nr:hypothetical protein JL722_5377 [Aureococcus anophagefferens]
MSHPFAAQDRAVYGMGFYRAHVVGFPDRQRALRDLGFVWERLQPEYNLVVEALAAFRDVFGHLLVPSAFVVPSGDPAWPPGTAGLPLGRRARQIRRRLDHVAGDERRCRQLDELGFVWDPARHRAGKGCDIPNFSAVFHSFRLIFGRAIISRNGRSVDAFFGTRARGTLTLKRR